MSYKTLPLAVKRSLAGKLGSYFNKLNMKEWAVPDSSKEMYLILIGYLQPRQDRWIDSRLDDWLRTQEGRDYIREKCEEWWEKWYKLKDRKGASLTLGTKYRNEI